MVLCRQSELYIYKLNTSRKLYRISLTDLFRILTIAYTKLKTQNNDTPMVTEPFYVGMSNEPIYHPKFNAQIFELKHRTISKTLFLDLASKHAFTSYNDETIISILHCIPEKSWVQ